MYILGKVTRMNWTQIQLLSLIYILSWFSIEAGPTNQIPIESGLPYIHNYTSNDFGRYIQHWSIVQLHTGEFIIGNLGGYNVYDSATWQSYDIPNSSVLSLDIDEIGTVYIGGSAQIGFLSADSIGILRYHSLNNKIPDQFREFTYVRETYSAKDGVYFRSREFIFRWDGVYIKAWEPKKSFHFMHLVNGQIYVHQPGYGLFQIKNDTLELLPGGEMFATEVVPVILPWDESALLIGTRSGGFFIYDGVSYKSFTISSYPYIKKHQLYHGSILPDGSIILATLQGGVMHMGRDGSLKRIINKKVGLQDDTVYYTYVDQSGALWVCLNNGISRIDILSPLRWFDERMGLEGMVMTMEYFNNTLFIGTTVGLFKLTKEDYNNTYRFELVSETLLYITVLYSVDSSLLIGTTMGLYILNNSNDIQLLIYGNILNIHLSKRIKNLFYINIEDKIFQYEITGGSISLIHESDQLNWSITDICEDDYGRLWVATKSHGIFRLYWTERFIDNISSTLHMESLGLPLQSELNQTGLFRLRNKIIVTATNGLFTYDDVTKQYYPELIVGKYYYDSEKQVNLAVEDELGDIWITSRRHIHQLRRIDNNRYKHSEGYLRKINMNQVNLIYPANDNTIWFGGSSGLIRYEKGHIYQQRKPPTARIRSVNIFNDSLIYGGFADSQNTILRIPYKNNKIYFRFSIPSFDPPLLNKYQVKLDPLDTEWSRLMEEPFKEYTNLPEGHYIFRVRGYDIYENSSDETFFEFYILPPWYRSWWSYSLYILLICTTLFGLHKYHLKNALKIEHTRMRIARDLHDDIGSNLSSIALMLDMISGKSEIYSEDRYRLLEIGDTTREIIDSLRDVVWVINPDHDKLATLTDRLKNIALSMLQKIEYTFDIRIDTLTESLSMDFKRNVILIFKEALNNIVKHSGAEKVLIRITESNGIFSLAILDNGNGFDTGEEYNGNGLKNMHYRALEIDGKLTVESIPYRGTYIELTSKIM
jgi:two-component sensor histidine kinase